MMPAFASHMMQLKSFLIPPVLLVPYKYVACRIIACVVQPLYLTV